MDEVEFVSQVLKINSVFCRDLTCEDIPLDGDQPYDYLLLGEILEHVDDPVDFLQKIRARHFPNVIERILLTVPNALRESNYRASKHNFERVNSDHRYWFTPYTICMGLTRSGFIANDIYLARHQPLKKKKAFGFKPVIRRHMQRKHPFLRDTIIVSASAMG